MLKGACYRFVGPLSGFIYRGGHDDWAAMRQSRRLILKLGRDSRPQLTDESSFRSDKPKKRLLDTTKLVKNWPEAIIGTRALHVYTHFILHGLVAVLSLNSGIRGLKAAIYVS